MSTTKDSSFNNALLILCAPTIAQLEPYVMTFQLEMSLSAMIQLGPSCKVHS